MKFKNRKEAHDAALTAHTKASAIKGKYATGVGMDQWAADDVQQFQGHMAEWSEAHDAYNKFKESDKSLETFDQATDFHTDASQAPILGGPEGARQVEQHIHRHYQQTPEQREQAAATHKRAMTRFILGGESALSQAERGAYLVGGRQLFDNANTREQMMNLLPQERHALVGTVDTLGGFLVPDEFMAELIRDLAGFSVIRPMARVRNTSRSAATFMTVASSGNDVYPSGISGNFRSEGWVVGGQNPPTQNQPRFGRERIQVHIWAPDVIELTMELMEDSAANLDAEIRALLAETRGLDEDSVFINGTGSGMPVGVLQEVALGNIATVASGGATSITYDGLVNLYTSLPAQYRRNASWLFNSFTLGLIMQLKGTDDHPIFPVNQIPTQLWNRPFEISEFMPDAGGAGSAGNNGMIFGDFRFYGIADRQDMRIIRLVERFAPNVGILAIARVGGQVLKTNPFRAQVTSA